MKQSVSFCKILVLLGLTLSLSEIRAQDFIELPLRKVYAIVSDSVNVIGNDTSLDDFFEKLYQLKSTGKGRVSILHIGDSHIQADYFTDAVRRNFQSSFGNAGRGLVFPLRAAGTNEPANYRSQASGSWNIKRMVFPAQPLPIGVCGITMQTTHPGSRISIRMQDPTVDYKFDVVQVIYLKNTESYDFVLKDSLGNYLGTAGAFTGDPFSMMSQVSLDRETGYLELEVSKTSESQSQATLFGLNLLNTSPGIIYHSVGINGARFLHYNQASYFAKQTRILQPDLIVVSLGTNDATGYPYLDKRFPDQVQNLIALLEEYNPDARILLTTPPDAFRRKTKLNPGIQQIREEILKYSVESGLAFWDMYKVHGGFRSASRWKAQGLLRPDGIHFTKEAYQYQGTLFFEALMKSYKRYVPFRHP